MLKYALMAGACALSVPAMAQEAPAAPQSTPAEQTTAMPDSSTDTAMAQTPTTGAQAAPAEQAAQAPAQSGPAPATQIAGVVKAEFPAYDKDKSGTLSTAEFGDWMGKLRKASEPALNTESAEVKTWIEGAFASADKDKSKSVTEGELTTFLTAAQQPS